MKYIITLFLLLNGLSSTAQSVTFNKTYDNAGIEALFNILQRNGNYEGAMINGHLVVPKKTGWTQWDSLGNITSHKEYGDSIEYQIFYNYKVVNDSTTIAMGLFYNTVTLQAYTRIYYFNNSGDTISTNNYYAPPGFRDNTGFCFLTKDKGILITGQIEDSLSTNGDVFIIKIDSNRILQWRNSYGGTLYDCGVASAETPDGGYLTLGWTRSFGLGNSSNRDMLLIKWDSLGNFVWKKTYGTVGIDGGTGISPTPDGNYLLAGYKGTPTNDIAGWIIKIDTAGIILWQNTYGYNTSELWWAKEDLDKSIIAVGSLRDTSNLSDQGWIIKTDSLGNLLWSRTFQLNNDPSYFRDFAYTNDGGVICSGFVFTGASGGQDAWLVKLDSLGCDSDGCPNYTSVGIPNVHQKEIYFFELYPNPVKESLVVKFTFPMFTTVEWTIYDLQGRIILKGNEFVREILSINTDFFQQGLYIIKIHAEGESYSSKFVKD